MNTIIRSNGYGFSRIYHEEDEFFSRWQNMSNVASGIIFVRKDKFIWLEGKTMQLPSSVEQRFYFDKKYVLIRNDEGHVWLAVLEEPADG